MTQLELILKISFYNIRHHATIEQMDDAMSEAGIVLGVCHHDDGGSFLIQFGKEVHHFLSVLGVEVTRRFVG